MEGKYRTIRLILLCAVMVLLLLGTTKHVAVKGTSDVPENRAHLHVLEFWGYHTSGYSVPNEELTWGANWNIGVINLHDEGSPAIRELKIEASTTLPISHWHVWGHGERPWPDEYLHGTDEVWTYNWWLWHALDDNVYTGVGFGALDPPTMTMKPGLSSSRWVSQEVFTEPSVQQINVTVNVEDVNVVRHLLIRILFKVPFLHREQPPINVSLVEDSISPPPTRITDYSIEWDVDVSEPTTLSFTATLQVTPPPGLKVRFIPGVHIHGIGSEEEPLLNEPVRTTQLSFQNVKVSDEGGVIGNITITTQDEVLWVSAKKFLARGIDYELIAESNEVSLHLFEHRDYCSSEDFISNEELEFNVHWSVFVHAHREPFGPIKDLKIEVNSTGHHVFKGWWTGPWPMPDEYLYGPDESWSYNWWLWYEVPLCLQHEVAFEDVQPIKVMEKLGMTSQRIVDNEIFTEPGFQKVKVVVTVEDPMEYQEMHVHIHVENPNVNASIYSAYPEPSHLTEEGVSWHLRNPKPGTYVFNATIYVNPPQGLKVRFKPGVTVSLGWSENVQRGVIADSLYIDNAYVTQATGVVGDLKASVTEPIMWSYIKILHKSIHHHLTAEVWENKVAAAAICILAHNTLAEELSGSDPIYFEHLVPPRVRNIDDATDEPVKSLMVTVKSPELNPYYPFLSSIIYPPLYPPDRYETPSVDLVDGNYRYTWSLGVLEEKRFIIRDLRLTEGSQESLGFNYEISCDKKIFDTPIALQHVTLKVTITERCANIFLFFLRDPALYAGNEAYIAVVGMSPPPTRHTPWGWIWVIRNPSEGDTYTFNITLAVRNYAYPKRIYHMPSFFAYWFGGWSPPQHVRGNNVTLNLNPYGFNVTIDYLAEGSYHWITLVAKSKGVDKLPLLGTKKALAQDYAQRMVLEIKEWVEELPLHEGIKKALASQYLVASELIGKAVSLIDEGRDEAANNKLKAAALILEANIKLIEALTNKKIPYHHAQLLIHCDRVAISALNKAIELTPSQTTQPVEAYGAIGSFNEDYYEYSTDNGKTWVTWTKCKVLLGGWAFTSIDGQTEFEAYYQELNIEEEVPGTIDFFYIKLVEVHSVTLTENRLEINGRLDWYKNGNYYAGLSTAEVTIIIIDHQDLYLILRFPTVTWRVKGTVHEFIPP